MKNGILVGLLSFLLGIGLALIVLVNPLEWSWAHSVHHSLLEWLPSSTAMVEGEGGEGQLWTCGMHPQVLQEEPGSCPICGMDLIPVKESTSGSRKSTSKEEREILYWQAPMDPSYTSDEPGKSPMGMDLVPVYAEEEQPQNTVQVDPSFIQAMGVETATVERTDIPFTIRTVGTVTYNDEQVHWVTTKYEGWIEEVHVNYVGEPVERGDPLFTIYSPQLVTTQKEYLDAIDYAERLSKGSYEEIGRRARALLESTRERLRYWDMTDEQIDALEKSRVPQRAVTVYAPVSGMVVDKMNQSLEGMFARPGMNLYQIVDLSTIWVEAEVFEDQIPWLEVGQSALLEFPYQPGRRYRGQIRYVYPYFNSKTRTLKVSISLPNPGLEFRKDMYANVTMDVPAARDVVAAPDEAILFSGRRNLVVLSLGEGEFQVREVTLGRHGQGLYEIKSGLEAGETIVVSSQFLIDSESRLKEAIQKMVSESGSAGTGAGENGERSPADGRSEEMGGQTMEGSHQH